MTVITFWWSFTVSMALPFPLEDGVPSHLELNSISSTRYSGLLLGACVVPVGRSEEAPQGYVIWVSLSPKGQVALGAVADRHHHHHGPPRTRKFERQSCRYTAVFSWDSCNTCCKIASRTNGNENSVGVQVTEPSRRITVVRLPYAFWSYMCSVFQYDIVGALMVFDPDMDFRRPDDHPDVSLMDLSEQLHFCIQSS